MTGVYIPPSPRTLLTAVRDLIRGNPARHDQKTWIGNSFGYLAEVSTGMLRPFAASPVPAEPEDPQNPLCGTTACVAGWAVILGGDPADMLVVNHSPLGDIIMDITDAAGNQVSFETRAQDLLNLSYNQAGWLFSENCSREEVLGALDLLIADPQAELGAEDAEEETW